MILDSTRLIPLTFFIFHFLFVCCFQVGTDFASDRDFAALDFLDEDLLGDTEGLRDHMRKRWNMALKSKNYSFGRYDRGWSFFFCLELRKAL